MNFDIVFKRNGNEYDGTSWSPGDKIEVILNMSSAVRSKISLLDNKSNIRYFSIHGGTSNSLLATISDDTRYLGEWELLISIVDNKDTRSKSFKINVSKNSTQHTKELLNLEDTGVNDDGLSDNYGSADIVKADYISSETEKLYEVHDVSVGSQIPVEDYSEKNKTNVSDVSEPLIEVALPDIIISGLTEVEIAQVLDEVRSEDDLDRILGIGLSNLQIVEFDIPVAEIMDMDRKYISILKDNDILYIGHMICMKPIEVMKLTGASLDEIKSWYMFIYKVYINENHMLRKEYRRIRMDYEEAQRQLKTLRDSDNAQDTLEVLSGVSTQAKDKLEEVGIVYVVDLLERTLLELINLEVDREKPLLPKLWLANAKSHIGVM